MFTLICLLMGGASAARADKVLLLPARAEGAGMPQVRLDDVDEAMAAAVTDAGHESVTEAWAIEATSEHPPQDANEMRAVAEMQGARWLVLPTLLDDAEGAYTLKLRVGFVDETRAEEVTVEVRASRERARLMEVLMALLRPEGLGDQRAILEGHDERARHAEAEAAPLADEVEPEPEAGPEAEAEPEPESEPQAESRRYGEPRRVLFAAFGVRPIVARDQGQGRGIGLVEFEFGHTFESAAGLELRAGLELNYGAIGGLGVTIGALYLKQPIEGLDLFLGGRVDIGLIGSWSGAGGAGFQVTGAFVASWNFAGDWYLEGTLPELGYTTLGQGGWTLGFTAGLGLRF